ncbi:MAG: nucleotidyltransferase family protein [Mitsuaria chitosanitabida]|uniref:N-acetylmuramate alpha-1-phosphate uridylyltransferase MurU n=1 Tax=Roseateles chitosanitabidus TaxID=65048 RepID=UPI001B2E85BB|nr:nucleotidyltransferase family protein [Roseateles chitosanitabidus]MBO9686728.1 nucleotidyltransferase family protein [Roseateles chitosanitabidus]
MRAMILAAGRGERMRPLTDHTPKPLLKVRGKPLIEWHIEAFARAGIRDIVINTAWLHEQFEATLGDGSRLGVRLHYSHEGKRFGQALETGGGIATALDLLCADGDDAFWAVSADIFMPEFVFDRAQAEAFAESALLAHLWFVPKQPRHPAGDFGIDAEGFATLDGDKQVYSNIGLYKRAFFDGVKPGVHERIRVALDRAIAARAVSAEIYEGPWVNVGSVDQLEELNAVR